MSLLGRWVTYLQFLVWGGPSSSLSRLYLAALRASPLNPSPHSIFALQIADDSTLYKLKNLPGLPRWDTCVIDQARGQDGWILAHFFLRFYSKTETNSRSVKTQKKKKRTRPVKASLTVQVGQLRIYYMANKGTFSCGTNARNPEMGPSCPLG